MHGGDERKKRHLAEEEAWEGEVIALRSSDRPLEKVSFFKYLGRLLTATDNDWLSIISNPQKSRIYGLDWIGYWVVIVWTLGRQCVATSPLPNQF